MKKIFEVLLCSARRLRRKETGSKDQVAPPPATLTSPAPETPVRRSPASSPRLRKSKQIGGKKYGCFGCGKMWSHPSKLARHMIKCTKGIKAFLKVNKRLRQQAQRPDQAPTSKAHMLMADMLASDEYEKMEFTDYSESCTDSEICLDEQEWSYLHDSTSKVTSLNEKHIFTSES